MHSDPRRACCYPPALSCSPQVASLISARASGGGSPVGSVRQSRSGASGGMCGFSDEECLKLLAAGKRPWDEDAADFLETC